MYIYEFIIIMIYFFMILFLVFCFIYYVEQKRDAPSVAASGCSKGRAVNRDPISRCKDHLEVSPFRRPVMDTAAELAAPRSTSTRVVLEKRRFCPERATGDARSLVPTPRVSRPGVQLRSNTTVIPRGRLNFDLFSIQCAPHGILQFECILAMRVSG